MTAPESLREALSSEQVDTRRTAVMELGERGDAQAAESAELLLRALGDGDWRVREEAIAVGREVALRWEMLPGLVDALCQGDNVGLRNAALELLGGLGGPAVRALLDALGTAEPTARKFIVEALALSGSRDVVPALARILRGDDENDAASVIEALAVIGGDDAERALREQLTARDPFLRMAAMDALNRLGARVPWEELWPLLADRLTSRVTLEALGRCERREAVDPLVGALGDRSGRVAATAAGALARLWRDSTLRPAVQRALERVDADGWARMAELARELSTPAAKAAVLLSCAGRRPEGLAPAVEMAQRDLIEPDALDAIRDWGWGAARGMLELAQREPDREAAVIEVVADLARVLPEGGGEDVVRVLRGRVRAAMHGAELDLLAAATRCMTAWAEGADARRLVALASSEHEDVREAAQLALESLAGREPDAVRGALLGVNPEGPGGAQLAVLIAQVGGVDAPARLHAALLADDPDIRSAAIRGLAESGEPRHAELIALSLTDESPEVQVAATEALGGLLAHPDAAGEAARGLAAALDGDAPLVQAAAARALGRARVEQAAPALRKLSEHRHPDVRVAALEALSRIGAGQDVPLYREALGDEDPAVAEVALHALWRQGADDARRAAQRALEHPARAVRSAAAALLGGVADREARESLRRRAGMETDALVIEAIERALDGGGAG
ncbi:MAG: HEAT repeat domain-containing protein [Myxococcales bacterium]|jgi:HEAT repeat protein